MINNIIHALTPSLIRGCVGMYPLTQNANNVYGPAGNMILNGAQITSEGTNTASGPMSIPAPYPNHLNYTIAFWMKHNTNPDNTWSRNVIHREPRAPGMWLFSHNNGVHFTTLFTYPDRSRANSGTDDSSDIITKNQWFHIAMVSQTLGPFLTRQFLYINGELKNTVTHSGVTSTPGPGDLLTFSNQVIWREIRIYDRAVSGSDVRQMMAIRSPV